MKKSTFLWIMCEEKLRVSTDRLYRFHRGRKETVVERIISNETFYKDSCLSFGDYVVFKTPVTKNLCVVGQVMNFEFNGVSKKTRKFPFTFCIIEINKNVWIRLSPCLTVTDRGCLEESGHKCFHVKDYICTTKISHFDLTHLVVNRFILGKLKRVVNAN